MAMDMDSAVFSAMQTEKPYKSYRKTILGQVYVKVLNPFSGEPAGVILRGESNTENSAIVDVWTEKQDVFLRTMNKKHFESGNLMAYTRPGSKGKSQKEKINAPSDEDLDTLLKAKFFTLQAALNKMETEAPLYRLLVKAVEQDKSEKIVNTIKERLSEIQSMDKKMQVVDV